MATERTVIDLDKSNKPVDDAKRKEFRAKMASVLSRGFVVDRLNVELPPDVHGEWIRDDAVAIAEARALGFEIDTKYATKSALHSDGSGKPKVGDAIFMVMPKWQKEELDAMKHEQYVNHHGIKTGKPSEETQYEAGISKETPVINESKTSNKSLSSMTSD